MIHSPTGPIPRQEQLGAPAASGGCADPRLLQRMVKRLTGLHIDNRAGSMSPEATMANAYLVAAGAGIGLVLIVAIVLDLGSRPVFGILLGSLILGAATSFAAGRGRNPEVASGAALSAIFGWPLLVAAMALASGGARADTDAPVEVVAIIVAVSLSSLLRTSVAAAWLAVMLTTVVIAKLMAGSITAETWLALIGVGAVGVVALVGRLTLDRLVKARGQLQSLVERLPFSDSLEVTANSVVNEVARAGGFDVVLLAALPPDGTVRHLAHASRLPGPLPLTPGQLLNNVRSEYLRTRVCDGPWYADWEADATPEHNARMFAAGLRSMLYVPISREGSVIGLLAVGYGSEVGVNHLGRRALLHESLPSTAEAASLIAAILAPKLLEIDDRAIEKAALLAMIEGGRFAPVFQPIVELASGNVIGYEALTRFADGERPDLVFAEAERLGLGRELEMATMAAAIEASSDLEPASAYLSVNLSPDFAMSIVPRKLLARLRRPLTIEVTEHVAIADYEGLRTAVRSLGRGVRLAVDDAGSGFASLRHVLELGPDIVKLDIEFIRKIDLDPARQALVAGMVHFAARGPFRLIAEGVETEGERRALLDLGVTYGQGYLFGKPEPARRAAGERADVA